MTKVPAGRSGYAIRDFVVCVGCIVVMVGMVVSLTGANRSLSQAAVCASNQQTLFGGLMAYVNTYNSFPPHHPYPTYTNEAASKNGIEINGFDPCIGWIMTYGLAMAPPSTFSNGHFQWFPLNPDELPSVCTCPAADHDRLFTLNEEIDANNPESFVYQYAAFYQTSGSCRAATPVVRLATGASRGTGGRAPLVPNPTYNYGDTTRNPVSRPTQNSLYGQAYIWCAQKDPGSDPLDISSSAWGIEQLCDIQAVHPAEVQDPARVYYLADSRDYRPYRNTTNDAWPGAASSDGWFAGFGNLVYLGTRHHGYANVMYLDGRVSRDNQRHPIARWNLDYDEDTGQARSDRWRCATFADILNVAYLGTHHHVMPVLMVKGWEQAFDADGLVTRPQ